jgi:hypothetical protein
MQYNSRSTRQAPYMTCGSSTFHSPASEGAAATSTAPTAAAATTAADAAALFPSDAIELLWGAAAVRRSNDDLLLAESVVSSSDSDSDEGTLAGQHMHYSRGQLWQDMLLGSRGCGNWEGRSSICSSVATASSNRSRGDSTLQQGPVSINTRMQTSQQQQQQQQQRHSNTAAPAAAEDAIDFDSARRTLSWHDSWDEEIDTFCDMLLPPLDNKQQGPGTCTQLEQHQVAVTAEAAYVAAAPADSTDQYHHQQQQREQQAATAAGSLNTAGTTSPGCSRCRQLEVQLQELQFEAELAAARAAAVAEERDLVLLQQQSLLDLIAQQQMHEQCGS